MCTRWSLVAMLAWILWIDATVYTLPSGPDDPTPPQLEGATGRWEQLAITETRAECRALRQARIEEASQLDATADEEDRRAGRRRARYREQNRYFCSPVENAGGR
jgi:hypothetical protein